MNPPGVSNLPPPMPGKGMEMGKGMGMGMGMGMGKGWGGPPPSFHPGPPGPPGPPGMMGRPPFPGPHMPPQGGKWMPGFFKTDKELAYDAKPAEDNPPNETLHVSNIRSSVNPGKVEEEMQRLFSKTGGLLRVLCMRSLKRRGQAWLTFSSKKAAERALERFQGVEVFGKPLRVSYSRNKSYLTLERERERGEGGEQPQMPEEPQVVKEPEMAKEGRGEEGTSEEGDMRDGEDSNEESQESGEREGGME